MNNVSPEEFSKEITNFHQSIFFVKIALFFCMTPPLTLGTSKKVVANIFPSMQICSTFFFTQIKEEFCQDKNIIICFQHTSKIYA
jgi:hypothetical protein